MSSFILSYFLLCVWCYIVWMHHFWLEKLGSSVVLAQKHLSKWQYWRQKKRVVTESPPRLCHQYQSTVHMTCIQWPRRQKVNLFGAVHKSTAERERERPLLEEGRLWCICLHWRSLLRRCSGLSLFISFQLRRGELIKNLPAGGPCRPL